MAILSANLSEATGGESSSGESYEVSYLIIADRLDMPWDIRSYINTGAAVPTGRESIVLPRYGVHVSGMPPVVNVSLDRWDSNNHNAKAVPTYNLPANGQGYSLWKYTVSYGSTDSNSGSSSDDSPPWESDVAENCTITVNTTQEHTCYAYLVDWVDEDDESKGEEVVSRVLKNSARDTLYTDQPKYEKVLSFDFSVKELEDVLKLVDLVGTINTKPILIAGVEFKLLGGCITTITPSLQKYNDEDYFKIHVEISFTTYTRVISTGYAAYLNIPGKEFPVKRPIRHFDGDLSLITKNFDPATADKTRVHITGIYWFLKDPTTASSGEDVKLWCDVTDALEHVWVGNKWVDSRFTKYSNPDTPLPLNVLGEIADGEDASAVDKDTDKQIVYRGPSKDWSFVGFPKRGFTHKKSSEKWHVTH